MCILENSLKDVARDVENSNNTDTSTVAHGQTVNVMEWDRNGTQISTATPVNFLRASELEEENWYSTTNLDRLGRTQGPLRMA